MEKTSKNKLYKSQNSDFIFKIVLIGDTSVGKSCILTRFADDQFSESYVTTIGVDFRFKTMIVKDKICKIQVWDTAGQERYRSITNAYYRGADAIFIIFDVTSKESFIHIDDWIEEIMKYVGKDAVIAIGANKSDLNNKEVSKEDIDVCKKKKGLNIFEVSAKTGNGVEGAFKTLAEKLIEKNTKGSDKKDKNNGIEITEENVGKGKNKKGGCCGGQKE